MKTNKPKNWISFGFKRGHIHFDYKLYTLFVKLNICKNIWQILFFLLLDEDPSHMSYI